MADEPLPLLSHVSIGTNDFERATAFYDRVMAALGAREMMRHPGAVAYGRRFPEFWVQTPIDGAPAICGNGTHVGFFVGDRETVDRTHAAAIAAGAVDDGPPGPRAEYGEPYYGAFFRDLDGHKMEIMFWDMSLDSNAGGS